MKQQFDQVAAAEQVLDALRRRHHVLALSYATKGIDAEAEIILEIEALVGRIQAQEEDIARLKARAAESGFSMGEAEYRVLLAQAWESPQGHPTVAWSVRLEFERVRLGVTPEKAYEFETQIRQLLVREVFSEIDIRALPGIAWFQNKNVELDLDTERAAQQLERVIHLDSALAFDLFRQCLVRPASYGSFNGQSIFQVSATIAELWSVLVDRHVDSGLQTRLEIEFFLDSCFSYFQSLCESVYQRAEASDIIEDKAKALYSIATGYRACRKEHLAMKALKDELVVLSCSEGPNLGKLMIECYQLMGAICLQQNRPKFLEYMRRANLIEYSWQ